ncbi:PAS domain S-box protein [Fodinibius sp. AD559]|uniref:PAS domain S-box protein n=1 Tax=Fodinibius sp. AD559 TaxID=3424179 RepID=UPI004046A02F
METQTLLFDHHPNPMFIFDTSTLEFLEVNRSATQKYGFTRDEFRKITIEDIRPPQDIPQLREELKSLDNDQTVADLGTVRHRTKDGKLLHVNITSQPFPMEGRQARIVHVHDVTESIELRNTLQTEKRRLEHAQQLAQCGWWTYNVDEDRTIWSDLLYDMLGVDKETYDGTYEAFRELVHPGDREKLDEVMAQVQHSNEPFDYTLRIGDGQWDEDLIYVKCRTEGIFNSEGELVKMTGILQDITEQKKADIELQRRETLFETLFLDAPVGIAMIAPDGNVQKVNQRFEELFGYSQEELIGEDLLAHQLPASRYDEIDGMYEKIFSEEGMTHFSEDQRITKQGEPKDLLVGKLPVTIDGDTIAAFAVYSDISRLKATERDLKNSLEEKEILLSEIHHRVKNNLAIISGLLLMESMNWEEDTMVYQVLTQSKLRIHSMAKIHEKLYQTGSFTDIDLGNYITELTETIVQNMNIRDKDISLTVDCDEVTLNINQALPCALIINELVTNAFKYAFNEGRPGELEVRFKNEGGTISLVVRDNGPGLPDDFEAMTETSLGHRLIHQLVKQLDGDIVVASGEPEGTRYEITFEKADKSGSSSNLQINKYKR